MTPQAAEVCQAIADCLRDQLDAVEYSAQLDVLTFAVVEALRLISADVAHERFGVAPGVPDFVPEGWS